MVAFLWTLFWPNRLGVYTELRTLAFLWTLFLQSSQNCGPWQFYGHFSEVCHRTADLSSSTDTFRTPLESVHRTADLGSYVEVPLKLRTLAVIWRLFCFPFNHDWSLKISSFCTQNFVTCLLKATYECKRLGPVHRPYPSSQVGFLFDPELQCKPILLVLLNPSYLDTLSIWIFKVGEGTKP